MKTETFNLSIGNVITEITYVVVLFFLFFGVVLHDASITMAGIGFLLFAFFTGGRIVKNDNLQDRGD